MARRLAAIALGISLSSWCVCAQQPAAAGGDAAGGAAGGEKPVTMDFPADGIEVRTLADIVTKRLKIPILYDESINGKKVVIRVPVDIPESALLGVLQSALRMKQLALVDAEQPGWKQIVVATNLAAVAKPAVAGQAAGTPVVQVFNLKQADPARIMETVRPFLTAGGGSVATVGGQRALIVSDYPSVVARAEQIIKMLDEGSPVEVKFIAIKNAEPQQVSATVQQILATKDGGGTTASGVVITPDERTGQVIVVAPKTRIAEISELISGVDKPLDLATKVYRLKSIAPDRLDRLVKNLVGAAAKRSYQSTVDKDSASLVVSATDDIHKRIEALVKELDQPVTEGQSPIRFYKLKNTKAADVLATISGLMGDSASVVRPSGGDSGDAGGQSLLIAPSSAGSDNRLPLRPSSGFTPLTGNPDATISPTSALNRPKVDDLGAMSGMTQRPATGVTPGNRTGDGASGEGDEGSALTGGKGKGITVTADVNTNSVIVIAPPAMQVLYEKLIKDLDQRRPQVQVECTIVTLDTSDNFSFGVDVAKLGGFGNSNVLALSSFGISKVDPSTGTLTPVNAQGGTFALLSPGIANVVIRALQSNSRARLISAPQLLVNDNGKGKLQSVSQEPFAEILDTSTTQSRTGLGGLAQAGTTISVEPHISEDEYLQLAYSIELSTFTGTGANGLPPPSQKNSVDSTVTIPDGNTIVVGGLHTRNVRESKDTLPFIDKIPFADWLLGSHSRTNSELTLFVFIKPIILRDDKFEDLKYLSDRALKDVKLPGQYPESMPLPLK